MAGFVPTIVCPSAPTHGYSMTLKIPYRYRLMSSVIDTFHRAEALKPTLATI